MIIGNTMEEWEIAYIEKDKLHPNILKDIEMGICPREVGNRLSAFSYELRQACFGEHYTVSRVYRGMTANGGCIAIFY